jgi:hypothetical protein
VLIAALIQLMAPLAANAAGADSINAFTVQGTGGWETEYDSLAFTLEDSAGVFGPVTFSGLTADGSRWNALVKPPVGELYQAGRTYPTRSSPGPGDAYLNVSGAGRSGLTNGSLEVLQAQYSAGKLVAFAADYVLYTNSALEEPTFGSLRWKSTIGFTGLHAPVETFISSTHYRSIVFPPTTEGQRSGIKPLRVENPGSTAVAIASARLTNEVGFAIETDSCSGRTLPPGAVCEVGVVMAPPTGGALASTLLIESPDLRSERFGARLAGQGVFLPPSNDAMSDAIEIRPTDLPYVLTQNSQSATADTGGIPDPAACFSSGGSTVWYRMSTGAAPMTIAAEKTIGSNVNLSVYRNDAGVLTPVGCGAWEKPLDPSTEYYFMFSGGSTSETWGFELTDVTPAPPPEEPDFRGLNPVRMLDTRSGPAVTSGTVRAVQVAGRAGVPADAGSVSMNVTVTGGSQAGYVTVFPCGQPRPLASNLNFSAGQTIPNAVIARVGGNGQVCLYASGTTHVIVDVNGYFPQGAHFTGRAPVRALDTRTTATVQPGQVIRVPMAGLHGVPLDASAVSMNVTVTEPTGSGYITVYPCSEPRPTASNLNHVAGQTIPNAVLSSIGDDGDVCLYSTARTHLIVDINGWFDAAAQYGAFSPLRALDTRTDFDSPLDPNEVVEIAVGEPGELTAVSMNVTVTGPASSGYITVFPCDSPRPTASNLNFSAGQTIPNAVISPVDPHGSVCFYTTSRTELIVDLNGVFLDP